MIGVRDYVAEWSNSPLNRLHPSIWALPERMSELVAELMLPLGTDYRAAGGCAIHRSAVVEIGATLKPPLVVGPGCFIAAGAYLRGGVFLQQEVTVGPGAEIKSSAIFAGTRIAHLNFIGDSIVGAGMNFEAGAIVANCRNEAPGRTILIRIGGDIIDTGVEKFGAIIGDGARIGANAVIAPGAVLKPGHVVPRLGLVDQSPNTGT